MSHVIALHDAFDTMSEQLAHVLDLCEALLACDLPPGLGVRMIEGIGMTCEQIAQKMAAFEITHGLVLTPRPGCAATNALLHDFSGEMMRLNMLCEHAPHHVTGHDAPMNAIKTGGAVIHQTYEAVRHECWWWLTT